MTKTFRSAAIALATAATLSLTVGAASAEAAPLKGCISKPEYRKIANGMTKAQVEKITKARGKAVVNTGGVTGVGYRACTGKKAGVGIAYSGGVVVSKTARWR